MADRSGTPSREASHNMFGIKSFCKAYRSLISKGHPDKNHYPNSHKPHPEDHFDSIDQTSKASNDRATNGFHDLRHNGEGTQGNDPLASPIGFHKNNQSGHSYFSSKPSPLSRSSSASYVSSVPSLSRSTSTRMTAASRFLRSLSRKNVDKAGRFQGGGGGGGRGFLSRTSSSQKAATSSAEGGGGGGDGGASLSRSSSSRKGATPIMFSNSNGLIKPPPIEKSLKCTLEELCFGCTKRIMMKRDVVSNNGEIVEEEETLTIKVKPGWRKGTKVTFEGMGNETPGSHPADIIFVIAEKKHPLFRREGDNLELAVKIPLVEALSGCSLPVPLLGGEKMSLTIDDIIETGYEKVIPGQGMPKSKEQGNRGDLIIKFIVEFPTELSDEQRADVFTILKDSC